MGTYTRLTCGNPEIVVKEESDNDNTSMRDAKEKVNAGSNSNTEDEREPNNKKDNAEPGGQENAPIMKSQEEEMTQLNIVIYIGIT